MRTYSKAVGFTERKGIYVYNAHRPTVMSYTFSMGALTITVKKCEQVFPYPYWECGEHSHKDVEIHVIDSGRGKITLSGKPFEVIRGSIFVCGPGLKHTQKAYEVRPMSEFCVIFSLTLDEQKATPWERDIVKTFYRRTNKVFFDVNELRPRFVRLFSNISSVAPGYMFVFQTQIARILADTYRTIKADIGVSGTKKIDDRAAKIKLFVDRNFHTGIQTKDVERQLFLSGKQINRILMKDCGKTVGQYITDFRFETARDLVKNTDMPTAKIAESCGYGSVSAMYSAFRKKGIGGIKDLRSP
jgi:AraC-type DNA-binding domain-containing proteins